MCVAIRGLLLSLFLLFGGAALAQTPASGCPAGESVEESGTSGKHALVLSWATPWQTTDGIVRFSIVGTKFEPSDVWACYRMRQSDPESKIRHPWYLLAGLQLEKIDNETHTYTVRVPSILKPPLPLTERVMELRVRAVAANAVLLDSTRTVRITSGWLAGAVTVVMLVLAGLALGYVRSNRAIPGQGWALALIASADGRASLSQAQIMLWTFVIGGAGTYVLLLNGNLVEIGDKVLWLLGISGVSVVAAKIKDAPKVEGGVSAVPDTVTNLLSVPDGDMLRLTWTPPPGEWRSIRYVVTGRLGDGQMRPVADDLLRPSLIVTGLAEGSWQFYVTAYNAAGSGPVSTTQKIDVAAVKDPGGALDPPGSVLVTEAEARPALGVTWTPVEGATGYRLRFRKRASAEEWRERAFSSVVHTATLEGLLGKSLYDVEVVTLDAAGKPGKPAKAFGTSGPREPRWTDLVVSEDGTGEINVTRVQMLFFTVITAGYVVLSVWRTQYIPDIPESILFLMGISNGVYLTAKFVPKP